MPDEGRLVSKIAPVCPALMLEVCSLSSWGFLSSFGGKHAVFCSWCAASQQGKGSLIPAAPYSPRQTRSPKNCSVYSATRTR